MKYLEREFYKGYWYFGNGSSATITNWLKIKDTVFRGIKQVARRHRRSIAQRDLHRLFPRLVVRMGYTWLKGDDIFPADYLCPKLRRMWIGE